MRLIIHTPTTKRRVLGTKRCGQQLCSWIQQNLTRTYYSPNETLTFIHTRTNVIRGPWWHIRTKLQLRNREEKERLRLRSIFEEAKQSLEVKGDETASLASLSDDDVLLLQRCWWLGGWFNDRESDSSSSSCSFPMLLFMLWA